MPEPLTSFEPFVGRLHPLAVHFPIALLLAAGLVEGWRWLAGRPVPSPTGRTCLALGALSALAAAGSGWLYAEHDPPGRSVADVLSWHRWLGVGTAAAAVVCWVAGAVAARPRDDGRGGGARRAYGLTLLLSCGLVSAGGHQGARLDLGEDFLWEAFAPAWERLRGGGEPVSDVDGGSGPEADGGGDPARDAGGAPGGGGRREGRGRPPDAAGGDDRAATEGTELDPWGALLGPGSGREASEGAPEAGRGPSSDPSAGGTPPLSGTAAAVDFHADVWPILEARCVDCHGPAKQKGRLRLDDPSHVFAGEPSEWVIRPGDAGASPLYRRVVLPPEDLDLMPAEGDPLTAEQTETLRRWIDAGADWPAGR